MRRLPLLGSCVLPMLLVASIGLAACGTIRTMPTLASYDVPKVYSGTRLDVCGAGQSEACHRQFSMNAPEHPLLDLPFSLVLDTIFLPVTVPVALYEIVFGH